MKFSDIFEEKRSEEHKPLNLESVDSDVSHMNTLLKKLVSRMKMLPEVDEEGRSEWPFAEGMYAVKENAEKDVALHLIKLQKDLETLEHEIYMCQSNLELIQSDSSHLHLEDVIKSYSNIEGSLEAYYAKAVQLEKVMIDVMDEAKEELRKAGKNKWPLGEPKETPYGQRISFNGFGNSEVPDLHSLAPSSPSNMAGSLNAEINNLMALGPLGRNILGQVFY
jgi:hypothetical protein